MSWDLPDLCSHVLPLILARKVKSRSRKGIKTTRDFFYICSKRFYKRLRLLNSYNLCFCIFFCMICRGSARSSCRHVFVAQQELSKRLIQS
jgi:hypothetical protein